MARRGRWGHLPPAAPDLSATIVALYEQYEHQRDQDIIDAWQNGGQFEGKKVTDSRMLDWFAMRRDQMDRQDPMWDYWNDQYHSTKFKIAEQKANLDYVRHQREDPVGANQKMADFYRQQAQELPRASSAWRDMMTSAAKFASAARAAGAAGRAGSATAAMTAQINHINKTQILPTQITMNAVWTAGAGLGLMGGNPDHPDYNLSTLGAASIDDLLAAVTTGGALMAAGVPDQGGNFYTPDELQMAKNDVHGYIGTAGFDGNLTVPHIIKMLDREADGHRRMAKVYAQHGYHDQAASERGKARSIDHTRATYVVIQANIPDRYLALNKGMHDDLANSHDPYETVQIKQDYADQIDKLAAETGKDGDVVSQGLMIQEAHAYRGGQAEGRSYGDWRSPSGGLQSSTDLTQVGADTAKDIENVKGLSDGSLTMVLTPDPQKPGQYQTLIVPKGTESHYLSGGDTNVITMPIEHFQSGVTVRDPETNKPLTIGQGSYTQMVTVTPVVVDVPATTDPTDFASPDLIGTGSFPGTESRRVGWRQDNGGEISYSAATNPADGGWSAEPLVTTQVGAIHSQGMGQDNVWHIQMDTTWALKHTVPTAAMGIPPQQLPFFADPNSDPGLESILSFIPNADPTKQGTWMANIQALLQPRPTEGQGITGGPGGAVPEMLPPVGATPTASPSPTDGLVTPGNIDLSQQPQYKNPDGSISTVRSISIGTDQGEVLIPTVWTDANGKTVSVDPNTDAGVKAATSHYEDTGKHLGIYSSVDAADKAAQQIHINEANRIAPSGTASPGTTREGVLPTRPNRYSPNLDNQPQTTPQTAPQTTPTEPEVNKGAGNHPGVTATGVQYWPAGYKPSAEDQSAYPHAGVVPAGAATPDQIGGNAYVGPPGADQNAVVGGVVPPDNAATATAPEVGKGAGNHPGTTASGAQYWPADYKPTPEDLSAFPHAIVASQATPTPLGPPAPSGRLGIDLGPFAGLTNYLGQMVDPNISTAPDLRSKNAYYGQQPVDPAAAAATARAMQQARVDAYNNQYWGNLATHPDAISWANPTLYYYASNQSRREQLLKIPRGELWAAMGKYDSRLLDPTSEIYKEASTQLDVLYVAGPTADMERQYFAQHPGTGFIVPGTNIPASNPDQTMNRIVAGVADAVQPWARANLGTPAGLTATAGTGSPQAGPITAPQTTDLTPTGEQPAAAPTPGPMAPLGPGAAGQDVTPGPRPLAGQKPAGVLTPQLQPAGIKPAVLTPVKPIKPAPTPQIQAPLPPSVPVAPSPTAPYTDPNGVYHPHGRSGPGVY